MSFISLKSSDQDPTLFTNTFTEGIFISDRSTLQLNSLLVNVDKDGIRITQGVNDVFYWNFATEEQDEYKNGTYMFKKIVITPGLYDTYTLGQEITDRLEESSILYSFRGNGTDPPGQTGFTFDLNEAQDKYSLSFDQLLGDDEVYGNYLLMESYPGRLLNDVETQYNTIGDKSVFVSDEIGAYNRFSLTTFGVNPQDNDPNNQSPEVWKVTNNGIRNNGGKFNCIVPFVSGLDSSTQGYETKPDCTFGLIRQQGLMSNTNITTFTTEFGEGVLDIEIKGNYEVNENGQGGGFDDYKISGQYINRFISNTSFEQVQDLFEPFFVSTIFTGVTPENVFNQNLFMELEITNTNVIILRMDLADPVNNNTANWDFTNAIDIVFDPTVQDGIKQNLMEINYPYVGVLGMNFSENEDFTIYTNNTKFQFWSQCVVDKEFLDSRNAPFNLSPQDFYNPNENLSYITQDLLNNVLHGSTLSNTVNIGTHDESLTIPKTNYEYYFPNTALLGQTPSWQDNEFYGYLVRNNVYMGFLLFETKGGLLIPKIKIKTSNNTDLRLQENDQISLVKPKSKNYKNYKNLAPPSAITGDLALLFRRPLDQDWEQEEISKPPSWVLDPILQENANTMTVLGYTNRFNDDIQPGFDFLLNWDGNALLADEKGQAGVTLAPSMLVELLDFPGLMGYIGGDPNSSSNFGGDVSKTVDIIAQSLFTPNNLTNSKTMTYFSSIGNPVQLNLPSNKVIYSITARLRKLTGGLITTLSGSTEIVLYLSNENYRKDFKFLDNYLTSQKSVNANIQGNEIATLNNPEHIMEVLNR